MGSNLNAATQRTPGPWVVKQLDANHWCIFDANGMIVATNMRSEANAAFIVKACNAHDELVAALRDADSVLAREGYVAESGIRVRIRAALAKVTT